MKEFEKFPEPGTKEYEELMKIHYYDYPWLIWVRFTDIFYNIKTFFKNVWFFRSELKTYQGYDFGFDINMLYRMYKIKEKSFKKAVNFIEDGEILLKEVQEILSILKDLKENDFIDEKYVENYKNLFKKLQDSYKFWW